MKAKALNQNFVLLIIGQALSMFGTVLLKFTVSLLILDLTSSAALFGTITAISYLPPVFLSLIAGIIADRNNKRNLMIALDGLYGIMAVLLVLSLSFSNVLIWITIIMVGLAVVSNLIGPLLAGLLYSVVGKTTLQGVRIIFWGCAICFFSAAILEAFVKIPKITLTSISNPLHAIKKDLGESLYFLTSKQIYVFKAILLNAVFVFLIQPLITTGAPFIIRVVLNLSSVLNGLSQAFMGAAGLIGGIIAGIIANKFRTGKIVIISIVVFISASIAGIFIMSAIQQNVPDDMLGRIMSFYSAIVSVALPTGILFYGFLYEKFINHLPAIMFLTSASILAVGYNW